MLNEAGENIPRRLPDGRMSAAYKAAWNAANPEYNRTYFSAYDATPGRVLYHRRMTLKTTLARQGDRIATLEARLETLHA